METTGQRSRGKVAGGLLLVLALAAAMRLPFLDQAIQGDDVYYLAQAEHAQIEPLHPSHVSYVFLGDQVDMRGHPHGPLDPWILAGLLAVTGDIREVPFHAAYIVFSLIAAGAMWSLARRFSPHPVWASLLFLATPAFVVNGGSLEADLPFLAFWMAGIALFVAGRVWLAALSMALAALAAGQAIFLIPILWAYCWLYRPKSRAAWAAALAPGAALLCWQLFERSSTGTLPASVLAGYITTYRFENLAAKFRSAAALAVHACFLVFPGLLFLPRKRTSGTAFLVAWIAIFFAGAVVVFFAGSARYLLPVAAPVALLVSRARPRWLAAGFAIQMCLSLGLAAANYQHWDGYRRFAEGLRTRTAGHRVWINGEWGLRYYLESAGALPLKRGQTLYPGDVVVSSQLAYPVQFSDPVVPLEVQDIRPRVPLRLIGLDSHSGYSTSDKGLLPFGISTGPADRVRAELVVERKPVLEFLPMSAGEQMVSGLYGAEAGGRWRWMARRGVVLLKSPDRPKKLVVEFTIPDPSPARRLTVAVDGRTVAGRTFAAPGAYTLESAPLAPPAPSVTVVLEADRAFSVAGDRRELSIIVTGIGFK